jgi:transcriptional regulator GlxA family with amidase domain
MKFAFLMYPGVEPIDLAALGVLSMARRLMPSLSFAVVAAEMAPQACASGLRVMPDACFADCPPVDALVVPGGPGWPQAAADTALLAFLRERAPGTLVVSLCTGAMILAAAGLLDGRVATTKVEVVEPEEAPIARLAREHPSVEARHALLVDGGDIVTGGGVGLCIDTMLHVLATRIDPGLAAETARILEYADAAHVNRQRLAPVDAPLRAASAAAGPRLP